MKTMLLCGWLGSVARAAANTFSVYSVRLEGERVKCTAQAPLNIAADSFLLVLEVVLDQTDGLHAPFLLTRPSLSLPTAEKACTHQLWKYSASRNALLFYSTFEAPAFQRRDHYRLMDGPVVLWTEADKLHIQTSARRLALNLRAYSQLPPAWSLTVASFWAFGHPRDDDMALVFAQTGGYCAGTSATEKEWLCLEAKVKSLGAELVSANRYVPSDYGKVATCVALHRGHVIERASGSFVPKYLFIVGTALNQVVVFDDGRPLYVIPVLSSPMVVTASDVLGGEMAFVVLDESRAVHAYMTRHKNKVETCAMWNGASNILIGDFSGCGHNQVLVISENREGNSDMESCQLFDLSTLPSGSEVQQRTDNTQATSSSLAEAFRALELRRKIGELYLCDLEKEFENKSELMEEGMHFLRSLQMASTRFTSSPMPPDPTLVTLLPGKLGIESAIDEDCGTGAHGFPTEEPACPLTQPTHTITLVKQWQRVVDHQWLVGVVIQSQEPLPNISVTLLWQGRLGTTHHTCTSKVIWTEGMQVTVTPKAKRLRLDTPLCVERECAVWRTCVVAACGEVPLVEEAVSSHASIVCSWGEEGGAAGSMVLGDVALCVDDLVRGMLTCDDRCLLMWQGNHEITMQQGDFSDKQIQDLACVLTAGLIEKVKVTSTHTPLSCLPAMLQARLPPHILVLPATCHGGDVILLPSPSSRTAGLGGVVLYVTVKPNAVLSILHKTASQLSLVLSLLRYVLPEDVSLTSILEDEAHLVATALVCLERELHNLDGMDPEETHASIKLSTATDLAISDLLH